MFFLFICLISIVEVYSAMSTLTYRRNYWDPIVRHVGFLLAGTGIVLLFHSLKPKFFILAALGLPVVIVLLVITKMYGVTENEAARWFSICGFSFQPSEMAKLSLIAFTAFQLCRSEETQAGRTFRWILCAAVPTCGLIFLDNFSTALLLFSIVFLMMFIGQTPLRQLGKLMATGALLAAVAVALVVYIPADSLPSGVFRRLLTWKARIQEFADDRQPPETYVITDDNYQVAHSKIAIAKGHISGVFPGNSQERDYLPQAYSDFIYAIIIEEMGIIGGIGVLALYIILFIRAGIIAHRCRELFPKYLVMGSALILVAQAFTNMSVAVNLIPVTGQPLPLISRGGTSILINCIYIGIILSVSRFETNKGLRREQEIREENAAAPVDKLLNEDLTVAPGNIETPTKQDIE
jgi:cell division protein FtsW